MIEKTLKFCKKNKIDYNKSCGNGWIVYIPQNTKEKFEKFLKSINYKFTTDNLPWSNWNYSITMYHIK